MESCLVKGVVCSIKLCLGLLLVVEHFDDFLPVDHLFNDAFRLSDKLLLCHEVMGRFASDGARDENGKNGTGYDDQTEPDRIVHHNDQNRQNGNQRNEQLREALRNHLAHGVDIIGVVGHDIAALMCVKIPDRERFHMDKNLFAELVKGFLCMNSLKLGVEGVDRQTKEVESSQNQHEMQHQRLGCRPIPSVCPCLFQHSHDFLLKDGRNSADHGTDQNQDNDGGQQRRVKAKQHFQEPGKGSGRFFHGVFVHAFASSPNPSSRSSCPCLFCER